MFTSVVKISYAIYEKMYQFSLKLFERLAKIMPKKFADNLALLFK